MYQPSKTHRGSVVLIYYKYSQLDWPPDTSSSWSLVIDEERVPSEKPDLEVGVDQVKRSCQVRGSLDHLLDMINGDAKYSNRYFLDALKDQPCGTVIRLRKDRVPFPLAHE